MLSIVKSNDPLDIKNDDRRVYSSMSDNPQKKMLLYGARSIQPNDIDKDHSGVPITDFASKLKPLHDPFDAIDSQSLSLMQTSEARSGTNSGPVVSPMGNQSFQFQAAPTQEELLVQENDSHKSMMKLQQNLQDVDDNIRLLDKLNATGSNYGSQNQLHPREPVKSDTFSHKSKSASEIKSFQPPSVKNKKEDKILKLPKLEKIQTGPKIVETLKQIEEVWGGIGKNKIPRPKLPYGFEGKNFDLINIKSELTSFKSTIEQTQPNAFDRKKVSLIHSKKQ